MTSKIIRMPPPNPKQRLFLAERHEIVIYGGARGGGKSFIARWKGALMCLNPDYKGIKVLIMRKSYPELVANHINPLKSLLHGVAKYNGTEHEMRFANGSTIKFMYCARDDDLEKLQGQEYDVIIIDEATQMSEYQIKQIYACLRGANNLPKRLYLTCNPGGKGHQYIKRLIERRFTADETPEDYVFIQALVQDNTALLTAQPKYVAQLRGLPPKLRDAWLYGRWDIFEGQFFEDFVDDPNHYADKKHTHVIAPLKPEEMRGWKLYRSFDWGYAKPFSCAWWAVDFDGVIYRILELYGCKKGEPNTGVKWVDDRIFAEIARIEREHPYLHGKRIEGVADPSIWAGSDVGLSRMDTAKKYGVYFAKGNNDRIAGWMQCRYRMAFDDNGYPMMYVFNTCEAFIRTIPLLCYDEHTPEDLDTDGEDHVADEWRYFCMARPIKPRETVAESAPVIDPLDQYARKNKRRA